MKQSANEVGEIITRFLDGTSGHHEWDDFTSVPNRDPFLNGVRLICFGVHDAFPAAEGSGHYCNEDGAALMRAMAEHLKSAK